MSLSPYIYPHFDKNGSNFNYKLVQLENYNVAHNKSFLENNEKCVP